MPVCNGDIHTYIGFLVVNVEARGGTKSRGIEVKRCCDTMLDFASGGGYRDPTIVGQKQSQQNWERHL